MIKRETLNFLHNSATVQRGAAGFPLNTASQKKVEGKRKKEKREKEKIFIAKWRDGN